jgi:2-iminobutanoate/2-iminopropanoate deaminase
VRRRAINSPDAPMASSMGAEAVELAGEGRLLFVSGQVPVGLDDVVPSDFTGQARQVWRNLEAQLRAADMTLDNLVKVTTFLSDRRYGGENRAVRMEVLGERTMALTVVIAGIFDEAWLLEIEAVAAA